MKNIVIHIPHSSLKLTREFFKRSLLSRTEIKTLNRFLCDLYTDKFMNDKRCYIAKFNYSRIFCDVEKFKDDSKEIMSKIGMGVVYTKDSDGNHLINIDKNYKEYVIKEYYDRHHHKMDNLITKILSKNKMCYIIDLHSFSDEQVKKTLSLLDCPDICIGIDDCFKDQNLNDYIIQYLRECGYKVKVNYPYSGSFVPNIAYNNKYTNVKSVMIELNKRLYLNSDYSINEKNFQKLKLDLNHLLDEIIKQTNNE